MPPGFFSRKFGHRDSEEYSSLQAEIARLEGTIAILEGVQAANAEDDGDPSHGEFSVSRLRAALTSEQLVSMRQELERLRARAAELRGEDSQLARPSSEGLPSSERKNRALLIGALVTFV